MTELTSDPRFTPAANARRNDRIQRHAPRPRSHRSATRPRRPSLDTAASLAIQPSRRLKRKPWKAPRRNRREQTADVRRALPQHEPNSSIAPQHHPLAPVQAVNTEPMPTTEDRPLAHRHQRCHVVELRLVAIAIARRDVTEPEKRSCGRQRRRWSRFVRTREPGHATSQHFQDSAQGQSDPLRASRLSDRALACSARLLREPARGEVRALRRQRKRRTLTT